MTKITKTQRWLDLIVYLAGRRYPVARSDLLTLPAYAAMKPGSAGRVFERDLQELRGAGIPIELRRESAGGNEPRDGYLLPTGGFTLPYLELARAGRADVREGVTGPGSIQLTEEEAADALEALDRAARIPGSPLAADARRAHAKLALDLDPGSFPGAPVVYAAPPGGGEPAELLAALGDAVLARRRVHFRYDGIRRGEATDRHVAPYGLVRTGGSWYLVGYDEDRGAVREFRIRRMSALAAGRQDAPAFEVPAGFRLEDRLGREAWELGDDPALPVRVRFHAPIATWAARNERGRAADGEEAVRVFEVRQPAPFLRWILSFAGAAEILDPPALREQAAALAHETAALYSAPDPDA